MAESQHFPRYSYAEGQLAQASVFHTAMSGEYLFGGEKVADQIPFLGYYSDIAQPKKVYDIPFASTSNLKYVAAAKLTSNTVMAYNSNRVIFALLGPPTQTDDMSLLLINPWDTTDSTYKLLGHYKIPGLNDKRRAISNNQFILLDSDMSTHHEVKAIMANEDDDGKAFNVFLVAFKLEMSQPVTITTSTKISSAPVASAPANSYLLNFLVEKRQSSPATEIFLGGPCYFQESGNTYSNCVFRIQTDLQPTTTEAAMLRHATTPSGYVETLDFFSVYDTKYIGVLSMRSSETGPLVENSQDLSIVVGCDGIQEFLSATLNYSAGAKKQHVLAIDTDMAGTLKVLVSKAGTTDLYLLSGSIMTSGSNCGVANSGQLSSLFAYDIVLTPPNAETLNSIYSGMIKLAEIYIGYHGTTNDSKELTIYQHYMTSSQQTLTANEGMHILSHGGVSGTDVVGFFGQSSSSFTPADESAGLSSLISEDTCGQRIYDIHSTCATDLSPQSSPNSVTKVVGTDINGQTSEDLMQGRLMSMYGSMCPINCCSVMTAGCQQDITGLAWLSHPSKTSANIVLDSSTVTSGTVQVQACLKCNNKYMEASSQDFTIMICHPIKALTSTSKVINLEHDEELDEATAIFNFDPLQNPDCTASVSYKLQSNAEFADPVADKVNGGYSVKPNTITIPFSSSFVLEATSGTLTYTETVTFEITRADPPPPPPVASIPEDAPFIIKLAPKFEEEFEDQAFDLSQEFLLIDGEVAKTSSEETRQISLPSVQSTNGDSSKVAITISTDPELASDDIITVESSSILIDFSKFSALDYLEGLEVLKAQAADLSNGEVESRERLELTVKLTLEEEGVDLKGESEFTMTISTTVVIQSSSDSEPESETGSDSKQSSAGALSAQGGEQDERELLTPEEMAELEEINDVLKETAGVRASPGVPFFILKFWAQVFQQEQEMQIGKKEDQPEEIELPPPLTAWVEDVSTLGLVDIEFSHPLDKALFKAEFISDRTLSVSLQQLTEEEQEPNSMTWELVSLGEKTMTIQLLFDNAILISTGEERDILNVEFENNFLFRSQEHQQYLETSASRALLSPQMPPSDAILAYDATTTAATESFKFITIIILLGQYLMKGLLKKILTAILALQIIVVYGKLGIKLPANIVNFLKKLSPFISFDLIKIVATFIKGIFTFDMTRHKEMAETGLKPALQDMGYKTFNAILNLGSLVAMLFYVFMKILVTGCASSARRTLSLKSNKLDRFIKGQEKTLFFSQPLTLALSGFMPIYTSVMLCLQNPLFTASGEVAAVLLTLVELVPLIGVLALAIWLTIGSTSDQRSDPDFKRRWGRLFSSIRHDTRLQLSYFLIFVLRRWIIIQAALSFGREYSVTILQMMLVTNIMMTIYLGHAKPKPSRFENRIELANDLVTTIAGYHLITFTEFTLNPELKFSIGWSFIGWIGVMLVGNLAFVLMDLLKSLYLLYVKYSRLFKRQSSFRRPSKPSQPSKPFSPSKDFRLLKKFSPSQIEALRQVLTEPQIEMILYYSKYKLDLPEDLQSAYSQSIFELENPASDFESVAFSRKDTEQGSFTSPQPTDRHEKNFGRQKSQFCKEDETKKLKKVKKKKRPASNKEATAPKDIPDFEPCAEEPSPVAPRNQIEALEELVDILSTSSKCSEVTPSTSRMKRSKTDGGNYARAFSGEKKAISKKKTVAPKRKNAANLSIIREESNISVDNEYSFFNSLK